jgi:hypothetical protein
MYLSVGILERTGPKPEWGHEYFLFDRSQIDLAKIREECERRRRGDVRNDPESCIIHLHGSQQPCEGRDHEEYRVG